MKAVEFSFKAATIELSVDEIQILKDSLNEVCHGVEIHGFETRLNASRDTVREILDEFVSLYRTMRKIETQADGG